MPCVSSRVNAAVVELNTLTDPVRAASENDHFSSVARAGLTFRRIEAIAFIRGVEVWSERGELGRASVDALINRSQIVILTACEYLRLVEPCQLAKPGIREAHLLEPQKRGAIVWQPVPPHALFNLHDLADAVEKPGFEVACGVDLLCGQPMPIGLGNQQ